MREESAGTKKGTKYHRGFSCSFPSDGPVPVFCILLHDDLHHRARRSAGRLTRFVYTANG